MKLINHKQTIGLSCDFDAGKKKIQRPSSNKLYRYKGKFKWNSVKIEQYKQQTGGWAKIKRQVLIGNNAETCKFNFRYFEIATGGYSSLEFHKHEHVIICIRGKGEVILNNKKHKLNYLDTVYISPNTIHQLINPYKEPFGFFCIVNAKRDKPTI